MKWTLSSHHSKTYGRYEHFADPSRCAERVYEKGGWGHNHQCRRARGHGPEKAFCRQHDPDAVKAREAKRQANEAAKFEVWRRQNWGPQFADALKAIARGADDPAALARDVLAKARIAPEKE